MNWIKIRTEYETTNTSYRKIAAKYEVSFNTLQCVAKREDWVKCKKETQDKILTKTRQKTVLKEVNRNTRLLSISDLATDAIEEYFKRKHYKYHLHKDLLGITGVYLDVADTKALSNMVSALERVQKGQRLADGTLSAMEAQQVAMNKHKVDIDNELLAIRQKELEIKVY